MKLVADDGSVIADDVQILSLNPNDVVILRVPTKLPDNIRDQLKDQWRHAFPNNKAVVLEGGMAIEILLGLSDEEKDKIRERARQEFGGPGGAHRVFRLGEENTYGPNS